MQFFFSKFAELRRNGKFPISYIVKNLKICRKTWWNWENGKNVPPEKYVRKLAKAINVPISLISDLEEEVPLSNYSISDITSLITAPILINNDKIDLAYDSITNMVLQLKRKQKHNSILMKALLCSNNVMFYVKDINLKYITTNELFLKTLSFDLNFICTGKQDNTFFSLKEAEENTKEDENVLITGAPIENREGYIPGTRKKRWGLMSKYPILDDNKKIAGIVGTFIDITERTLNERKRVLLEEVISSLPLGISISGGWDNLSRRNYYINNTYAEIRGLDKSTVTNEPDCRIKIVHPDDVEKLKRFRDLEQYPKSIDFRIIKKSDINEYWTRETTYKINNYYFSICEDITVRKKHEEINELLNIHINTSNRAIIIINLDTNQYEYISKVRESIYGRKVEEFYSNSIDFWVNECVHPEDKKEFQKILSNISEYKKAHMPVLEARIVRPNGKIRWIRQETTFIKFRNANGAIHVESDITAEKENDGIKELLNIYTQLSKDSISILDIDSSKYIYVNEAKGKLYERKLQDFIGVSPRFWINNYVYSEDRSKLSKYINNIAVIDKDRPITKYRIVTPDGLIKSVTCKTIFTKFRGKNCSMYIEEETK